MTTNNIDMRGLLRNALNLGVSITHAISELSDNSLSYGSTEVQLILPENKNVFIISDNGVGMNTEGLEKSGCLHSRTESRADRHGRFGFGGNQAQITLTNLEGSVISLSSDDGNNISQLTTDFLKVMETGKYNFQAHGIESRFLETWNNYAIKRDGTGTIIQTHLSQTNQSELLELFVSKTVTGLRFMIATIYRDALEKNVKISIKMKGGEYQIHPFDRLGCYLSDGVIADIQHERDSKVIVILRNKTTKKFVAHVKSSDGRSHTCLDKSRKHLVPVVETGDDSFEIVGEIMYDLAYSNKWNEMQKHDLERNGVVPVGKGQPGIQQFRELIGGTELNRNGKVVTQIPTKAKRGGDKAAFKYNDDTRARIKFAASEIMDAVFNIQVNKSQVNVDLIEPNVWKTIDIIRKAFCDKCYNTLDPNKASAKVIQPASSQRSTPANNARATFTKSAGGARSRTQSITESETSDSDSVCASDNESTTDDEAEPAIVAAPSEEVESAIVAAPSEEIELAIVAAPSEEVEPAIVAAPSEEVEPAIVAAPNEEIEEGDPVNAMPVVVPDLTYTVSESERSNLRRTKGEEILEMWKNSDEHVGSFNAMLDDLHIAYSGDCAADKLRRYLSICTDSSLKYYLLIELIRERHPSPDDHMKGGAELRRKYNAIFGTDNESD
jgi:hypothetical protein